MGFKQAAILAPVSFFLGILFICFNIDHRLLWADLTDEIVEDGFQFYAIFYNSPPAIKALIHGMIGVCIIGLMSKLHKWDDSAMFFDGSCLGIFIFAICVYISVIIPMLATTAEPLEVDSRADRVEAMRVLSAANVIVIVCLGAILVLQAGQVYARRVEAKELSQVEAEEKAKAATQKKDL
ncbi:Protein csh3 [Stygiomarasmius scandens]|uniref:Protein csh3 n=1 Tax=Marasmiellus scandens TaxID=2682957 RepID=A0ABR1K046_9AGAR